MRKGELNRANDQSLEKILTKNGPVLPKIGS